MFFRPRSVRALSLRLTPPRPRVLATVLGVILAAAGALAPPASAQDYGGRWTPMNPTSARSRHAAAWDPDRSCMLVMGGDGGGVYRNDVFAYIPDHWAPWEGFAVLAEPPRADRPAVYDEARHRFLLFGGYGYAGFVNATCVVDAVDPSLSQTLATAGPLPTARYGHACVYDPIGDRLLVFGGLTSGSMLLNDLWELRLQGEPTWNQLYPDGPVPPPRYRHAAAFDPAHNRMLVFGGYTDAQTNELWELSFASGTPIWTELPQTAAIPEPRYGHTLTPDPARNRVLLFGGETASLAGYNDLWALSLDLSPQWEPIIPSGDLPAARWCHSLVLDPDRSLLYLYAGAGEGGVPLNDFWTLNLNGAPAWSGFPIHNPPKRLEAMAGYDPVQRRMIMCGGHDGGTFRTDLWEYGLGSATGWRPLAHSGAFLRTAASMVYDSARHRFVFFGGESFPYEEFSETDVLNLGDPPEFYEAHPSGALPPERAHHSAIYDPVGDQMVVFGGEQGMQPNPTSLGDVWVLPFSGPLVWKQLTPGGTAPTARWGHMANYDPVSHSMIVVGGKNATPLSDVWSLSLGDDPQWTCLLPTGASSSRFMQSSTYDPVRHRLVMYGGLGGLGLLRLDGQPHWVGSETPGGFAPPSGYGMVSAFDPVEDAMVVWGGGQLHLNYFDESGTDTGGILQFDGVLVSTPDDPFGGTIPAGLSVLRVRPNPARDEAWISLRGSTAPIEFDVFDALGRRVAGSRRLAAPTPVSAPGRGDPSPSSFTGVDRSDGWRVRWDMRDGRGLPVPSGVYVIRARSGSAAASSTARLVVIR